MMKKFLMLCLTSAIILTGCGSSHSVVKDFSDNFGWIWDDDSGNVFPESFYRDGRETWGDGKNSDNDTDLFTIIERKIWKE